MAVMRTTLRYARAALAMKFVAYNVSEADSESQDLDTTTCTSVFVHIIPESEWGGDVADHLADPALSVGRQGKPVINSTDTCLTGWPL